DLLKRWLFGLLIGSGIGRARRPTIWFSFAWPTFSSATQAVIVIGRNGSGLNSALLAIRRTFTNGKSQPDGWLVALSILHLLICRRQQTKKPTASQGYFNRPVNFPKCQIPNIALPTTL